MACVVFVVILVFFIGYGGCRRLAYDRAVSLGQDEHRGAFRFYLINNSSLPLNLLALPKLARVYAESKNSLLPKKSFDFLAAMGAYDFFATIDDGSNGWHNAGEAGWGMAKDGISIYVGAVSGAGITGTLAVSAAAAVTTSLVASAAAPAVITLAAYATFFGVAVFSSMACSFLTEASMNFARGRIDELVEENKQRGIDGVYEELNKQAIGLINYTHHFLPDSKVAELGMSEEGPNSYMCCCRLDSSKTGVTCELTPTDTPKTIWWKSGCGGALGSEYHSWNTVPNLKEFKNAENAGSCVVPRGIVGVGLDSPERLFPLRSVVKETMVLSSLAISFPDLDPASTLMNRLSAEAYLESLQSKFTEWKIAKGVERRFVIAGGFINPAPLKLAGNTASKWMQIDFVPLQMGEVQPSHGCSYAIDAEHWKGRADKCRKMCGKKWAPQTLNFSRVAAVDGLNECHKACILPFKTALEQEVEIRDRHAALKRLEGKQVKILGNVTRLQQASVAARLETDRAKNRARRIDEIGIVAKVDVHASVAEVGFGPRMKMQMVKFPLEALALNVDGQYVAQFTPEARRALAGEPRYGECWSKCSRPDTFWDQVAKGVKTVATLGRPEWCHSAPTAIEDDSVRIGQLCKSDDECGGVGDSDEHWTCVDECS